jgi:hypothetical protein
MGEIKLLNRNPKKICIFQQNKNKTKEVKTSKNELGLVHFTINVMQICKNGGRIVLTGILKR